jgi:pimeloyl-ACP methyl ester carboxylesterase
MSNGWTRRRWVAPALGVLSLTLVLAGADPVAASLGGSRRVKVDGHRLYVECIGRGSPAIVFESGLGQDHTAWDAILRDVSGSLKTRACSYDRYGLGLSDKPATLTTRTLARTVRDKHALLEEVGAKAPYVLVSTSMGGIIDRYYTKQYPKQVAGLVQLDAVPDDWDLFVGVEAFREGDVEIDGQEASASLRARDSLAARPTIIAESSDPNDLAALAASVSSRTVSEVLKFWDERQRALARKSSNSIFVVSKFTSHDLFVYTAGDLIERSIKLVTKALRTKSHLPSCSKSGLPTVGGRC